MRYKHISVAVPLLAERDNLPALFDSFRKQTFRDFTVYVCVNNPASWSECDSGPERQMYDDNARSLEWLDSERYSAGFRLVVFSRQWNGKRNGVGWARKELFDSIDADCDKDEIVVSLDADTSFSATYLESVMSELNDNTDCCALCVPYYHPLSGDERCDRAMLRYEIYMRHYLLNLLESNNPYAFSALGSAMVFPLWAYRRVGGITPLQGGEDFYLMQKFAKTGKVLLSCNEVVRPQGRPSLRVPFGTGPAIAKGLDSMDDTYPLYPCEAFRSVADTFALFPQLYDIDIETPMSVFLRQQLKTDEIWQPLRKNFKTRELFVHACQERVDGLRILQFLKTFPRRPAEQELQLFSKSHKISLPADFSFRSSCIGDINALRDSLFELERRERSRQR